MSKREAFSHDVTLHIRDSCLCLHVQRAARVLARRFDDALRPLGLTSGQFSLLTSLNRPVAPSIGTVAAALAMDRTTLTANLKPLERRRLVKVVVGKNDKRNHLLQLTGAGHRLLDEALPVWRQTHAAVERRIPGTDRLRADLAALS
jgi:DNA-binding MarR family transcriptional regulator